MVKGWHENAAAVMYQADPRHQIGGHAMKQHQGEPDAPPERELRGRQQTGQQEEEPTLAQPLPGKDGAGRTAAAGKPGSRAGASPRGAGAYPQGAGTSPQGAGASPQGAGALGLTSTSSLPPPARRPGGALLRHVLSEKNSVKDEAAENILSTLVAGGMRSPGQSPRPTDGGLAQQPRQQARAQGQSKSAAALCAGNLERFSRLADISEGRNDSNEGTCEGTCEQAFLGGQPGEDRNRLTSAASCDSRGGERDLWMHRACSETLRSAHELDAGAALIGRAASVASAAQVAESRPRQGDPAGAAPARTESTGDLFFDFSGSNRQQRQPQQQGNRGQGPLNESALNAEDAEEDDSDLFIWTPEPAAVAPRAQGFTGHRDAGAKPGGSPLMHQPGAQLGLGTRADGMSRAGDSPAKAIAAGGEEAGGEWRPGSRHLRATEPVRANGTRFRGHRSETFGLSRSPVSVSPLSAVGGQLGPSSELRPAARSRRGAMKLQPSGEDEGQGSGRGGGSPAWVDHPGLFISGPAAVQGQHLPGTPKGLHSKWDAARGPKRAPPLSLELGGSGQPLEQGGVSELGASAGCTDAGRFARQLLASPRRHHLPRARHRSMQKTGLNVPWSLPEVEAQDQDLGQEGSSPFGGSPLFSSHSQHGLDASMLSPEFYDRSPSTAQNSPGPIQMRQGGGGAALRSHVSNPWPKGMSAANLATTDALAAALEDLSWNPFHSQGFSCGGGGYSHRPFSGNSTISSGVSEGTDFLSPMAQGCHSVHGAHAATKALVTASHMPSRGMRSNVSHSGPLRLHPAMEQTAPSLPPSPAMSLAGARARAAPGGAPLETDDAARVPSFVAAAQRGGRSTRNGQAGQAGGTRSGACTTFSEHYAASNSAIPGNLGNLDLAAGPGGRSRMGPSPGPLSASLGSKAIMRGTGSAALSLVSLRAKHEPCLIYYDQDRFEETNATPLSLKEELAMLDLVDDCNLVPPSESAQQGQAALLPGRGAVLSTPSLPAGRANLSPGTPAEISAGSTSVGHAAGLPPLSHAHFSQPQMPSSLLPGGLRKGSLQRAEGAGGSGTFLQGQGREERLRRRRRRSLDYARTRAELPGTHCDSSTTATDAQYGSFDEDEEEDAVEEPAGSRQGDEGEAHQPELVRSRNDGIASWKPKDGVIEELLKLNVKPSKLGRVASGAAVSSVAASGQAKPSRKSRAWPLGSRLQRLGKELLGPVPTSVLGVPALDISASYSLGKMLGEGQFGITRVVEFKATGDTFACKTIKKANIKGKADLDDVKRECAIFEMLKDQPHVPRLHDTFEDTEEIHFVMELCHGGDLFERITLRKRFTEHKAACVLRTLLQVIQCCHERFIVHRDIKPENILLCSKASDTDIKVIDFGIAAILKPGSKPLTELMGSPFYIAPEVIGGSYGFEADVWSAGIVLYVLLMGVPPFYAKTQAGILRAVREAKLTFRKGVPLSEAGRDFVCRLLDKDPKTRITTAEALAHPWLAAFTAPPRF